MQNSVTQMVSRRRQFDSVGTAASATALAAHSFLGSIQVAGIDFQSPS